MRREAMARAANAPFRSSHRTPVYTAQIREGFSEAAAADGGDSIFRLELVLHGSAQRAYPGFRQAVEVSTGRYVALGVAL